MKEKSKLTKYSEYLGVDSNLFDKYGICDGYIFIDTPLYVHPHLLSITKIKEFKDSNNKINNHFETTIKLLNNITSFNNNNTMTRLLLKHFKFSEPEGIGLGTSTNSINGNGLSGTTAQLTLESMKEIVNLGIQDPEIYRLLALVQKNIGVDRISDMICSIIYDDILSYTENMLIKLGIIANKIVKHKEKEYKICKRPNGKNLLFVPKEILSEIPIAVDYDTISIVAQENEQVKEYLGKYIENATKSELRKRKKQNLSTILLGNKELLEELIIIIKSEQIKPYDFNRDILDINTSVESMKCFLNNNNDIIKVDNKGLSLFELVGVLIERFKHCIENLGLDDELYCTNDKGKKIPKKEITSHKLFILILESAKLFNNYDYTFEAQVGNGKVEFKITNIKETVLAEFKLNKNDLIHGYTKQLPIYMKRFETDVAYFVIIKVVDTKSIDNFRKEVGAISHKMPVITIDALPKKSPSKI